MNRTAPTPQSADRIAIALGATAIAALILTSCAQYRPSEERMTVAADPVDCADGTPGACISVTDASGDLWITRPDEIAGFVYEPGFAYELLVERPSEVSEIESPEPVRPRLIRVLSKQAAGLSGEQLSESLERGEWRLASVAPSGHSEADWAATSITARFDVAAGRLSGFAGCNNYFAALAVAGDRLEVSAPASTRKACAPETIMALEQEYLTRITGATAFVVTAELLELTLSDGGGMQFKAAAD
jgi:heat shock protein HslJ